MQIKLARFAVQVEVGYTAIIFVSIYKRYRPYLEKEYAIYSLMYLSWLSSSCIIFFKYNWFKLFYILRKKVIEIACSYDKWLVLFLAGYQMSFAKFKGKERVLFHFILVIHIGERAWKLVFVPSIL